MCHHVHRFLAFLFALAFLLVFTADARAAGSIIHLPDPDKTGGIPLMQALNARHSNRSIKPEALPENEISNLAWAAWGINRNDGRRTIPTAKNEQKLNLYLAMASGVWLYNAQTNTLQQVMPDNLCANFGGAPLTLIYTAASDIEFSGIHTGSMYQNVGLYCASAGLANVVKISGMGSLRNLPLPSGYKVMIVQSVGWPQQ